MKEHYQKKFSTDLSKSILTTLIRYFPPKKFNVVLIDVVNILIDGISRGDIYIDIRQPSISFDLQHKGWPKNHIKALLASGWTEGANSPIVFINNKISWRRTHNEINTTINKILLRKNHVNTQSKQFKVEIKYKVSDHLNFQQNKAVELVDSEKIILLSGGPGTGKTSTILQMLLKALTTNPYLDIAMAAPTGKAAKKLKDTFLVGLKNLEIPLKDKLSKVPCKTLHKLLEAGPNGFKRNSQHLLKLDLIVIDEMSMVDLTLFNGLLDSLPKSCQIILVGDPDQLLPVGSGGIWQILQSEEMNKVFHLNSVRLTKSYRNKGDIALLRNTLKYEGLDAFWRLLSIKKHSSNVTQHISPSKSIPDFIKKTLFDYRNNLKIFTKKCITSISKEAWKSSMIEITPSPEILELFRLIDSLLILCPQTNGPWGVRQINQYLLGENFESRDKDWDQGTPIMARSNQPDIGIANGDVGIVIGHGENRRFLFNVFSGEQKLVTRLINPSRLNMFDAAFAMTIHKSQGSEANQVLLLWPDTSKISKDNNFQRTYTNDYEKRMIYTAITRAKKQLLVITNKEEDF